MEKLKEVIKEIGNTKSVGKIFPRSGIEDEERDQRKKLSIL